MGQITIRDLKLLGNAAARFTARMHDVAYAGHFVEALELTERRLVELKGRLEFAVPPPLVAREGWYSSTGDSWSREFWDAAELQPSEMSGGWYAVLSKRPGHEHVRDDSNLTATFVSLGLHPDGLTEEVFLRAGEYPGQTVRLALPKRSLLSAVAMLRVAGKVQGNQPPSEVRRLFQALDGLTPNPTVAIDLAWEPGYVRDTVMAQIAEWWVRVGRTEYARMEPAGDVYDWWLGWASQVARRSGKTEGLSYSDLFEVASRTVRPDSPAGHRKYWSRSLGWRPRTLVLQAAQECGVSPRTVYNWLKSGGQSVREFEDESNPLAALCQWLAANRPLQRIPADRREVREAIEAAGLGKAWARKLEYRTRGLDPEEKKRKIRAAIERALH